MASPPLSTIAAPVAARPLILKPRAAKTSRKWILITILVVVVLATLVVAGWFLMPTNEETFIGSFPLDIVDDELHQGEMLGQGAFGGVKNCLVAEPLLATLDGVESVRNTEYVGKFTCGGSSQLYGLPNDTNSSFLFKRLKVPGKDFYSNRFQIASPEDGNWLSKDKGENVFSNSGQPPAVFELTPQNTKNPNENYWLKIVDGNSLLQCKAPDMQCIDTQRQDSTRLYKFVIRKK